MASKPVMLNGKFLSAAPTGVHRVADQLVRHLDRLAPHGPGDRWSLLCPRDAHRTLPLEAIERRRVGVLTWQAWEQLELPAIARDGVLVNLCNLAPLAHTSCVTMIHDAQVFLTPESYSAPFLAWYHFALPRIGAKAARILTVSEYSRDRLAQFGVAPKEKISVVHNGVDHFEAVVAEPGIVARLGLTPRGFVLAAAGAQKHKNLGVLFDAFGAPALGHLTLVVAGPDTEAEFLGAGLRPPKRTVFAGRVSDPELRGLYENAACFAFPSTTEGFGLPPLEAMSLGCPAVVAPCGALPEVCGAAAVYAAPGDAAEWVRAILHATADGEARTEMRRAGLARAGLFRWRDSARKLLDIVEGVAIRAPCAA